MKIWYQIRKEDRWETVDYDTYAGFDGKKRIWGPTHGLALFQDYLHSLMVKAVNKR